MLKKVLNRKKRHLKIRAKIIGTSSRPRLCVFKSNVYIYAQLIDDTSKKTLCSANDMKIDKGTKVERAKIVGEEISKKAKELGVSSCVFDRGGFIYIGRVRALAEQARSYGLVF